MKRKISFILLFFLLALQPCKSQDNLIKLLKSELLTEMEEMKNDAYAPYYMNFRVVDLQTYTVKASMGALSLSYENRSRSLTPQIRVGNAQLDNFTDGQMGMFPQATALPLEEKGGEMAIRQKIWSDVKERYKVAVKQLEQARSGKNTKVENEDKSSNFTPIKIEKYYEAPLSASKIKWDQVAMENKAKRYSALFQKNKKITTGDATINFKVQRNYFVSSEGSEIAENRTYALIQIYAQTTADDGMQLPLYLSYFAYTPEGFPKDEVVMKDINELMDRLDKLRTAPVVGPFTGPALLSGSASGVFFHEIFGHRIEGQRMKSDFDGQTFKKMVGEFVLPADMNVYDDPTMPYYNKAALNGFYKFDEQGVKGEKVHVVRDGKLSDFLMTRVALDKFPRSNGHARADVGYDPVSRQSNLIIESKKPKTDKELRQLLIDEAKKQGKEFGYFFKAVTGGFTMTGRTMPNSFNVMPLEVYRIYVDGRPDELVRGVDLIGTPLSMFSNIIHCGSNPEIFTGTCGAESGGIPVTAISPDILVNKIEIQRKSKSRELPPILERP